MSLKTNITTYLQGKNDWVHKGELGRKAVLEWGFENENMGRRCRELENAGVIERELRKNPNTGVWEAWYRYKQSYVMASGTVLTKPVNIISFEKGYCCYSFYKFNTHDPINCQTLKIKENRLF